MCKYPPTLPLPPLFQAVTFIVPVSLSDNLPSEGSTEYARSSPNRFSSTLYLGASSPNQVKFPESQFPSLVPATLTKTNSSISYSPLSSTTIAVSFVNFQRGETAFFAYNFNNILTCV